MLKRFLMSTALACLATVAGAADIQPQSGTWAGSVVFDGQTGCPQQMVSQMQAGLPGYTGETLNFPMPFDPVALQGNDPNFVWTKISTNVWEGIFSDIQSTAMGTLTVVSKSIVVVLAPEKINQIAELTVDLPQPLAQQMGMATTVCFIRSNVYHERTGP